jgi:hypothetical protein
MHRAWPGLLNRHSQLAAGDAELAVITAEESVELTRDVDNGLIPAATGLALSAARASKPRGFRSRRPSS